MYSLCLETEPINACVGSRIKRVGSRCPISSYVEVSFIEGQTRQWERAGGETTWTLVPWRPGFRHPTRNEYGLVRPNCGKGS